MSRIRDYLNFLIWKAGLSYIALWTVAFLTLDYAPSVLGGSGVCRPDAAKVLFYWVCDPASALSIVAAVANAALTVTVWAPVYIAAATVRPEAIVLALPIVATHVVGLPAALFVSVRAMAAALALLRRLVRSAPAADEAGPDPARIAAAASRRAPTAPRASFGLRAVS
jgi:hypothetical protein